MELMHELMKRMMHTLDRLEQNQQVIVQRLGSLETSVANIHVDLAAISIRIDGLDERFTRMEKRLDLADA